MEGIKLQIIQNKLSKVPNHNLRNLISHILNQTMKDESEQHEQITHKQMDTPYTPHPITNNGHY